MKKIILFGAGDAGKRALKFFGDKQVYAFVDNNKALWGTEVMGKPVLSTEEFVKIQKDYQTVISTLEYADISKQIEAMGVTEYEKFTVPSYYNIDKFLKINGIERYSKVAVYGFGKDTETLINSLGSRMYGLIDRNDSIHIGQACEGYTAMRLDWLIDQIDCIVIGNSLYHQAIKTRLERELKNRNIAVLDPFYMVSYYPVNRLIVNPYENAKYEALTENEKNARSDRRNDYFNAVAAYTQEALRTEPLPRLIEIETVNRCNGICDFCPINRNLDPRPKAVMDESLFKKIILELEDMDYDGRLAPFSNNEPLLDERIVKLVAFARAHLLKARIHMFTNGTLMTLPVFKALIENLDELIIDNYNQELKVISPVKPIVEYCNEHPQLIEKVTVVLRKPKEILSTRGGDAPNRHELPDYPDVACALPFQQMVVRPTGQISLCCNDPMGKYTLGDLNKQSITEVWYGESFRKAREALAQGRGNWGSCKSCDVFSLYL